MAKRVKLGDIFRVKTKNGYGYIQYILKSEKHGYLIKIINGRYSKNENEINDIALKKTNFYCFFPLQSLFNSSEKKKITTEDNLIELILFRGFSIPEEDKNPTLVSGQWGNWGLWKNDKEIDIGESLDDKYKHLSDVSSYNYEALIISIDNNYKASDNILFKD